MTPDSVTEGSVCKQDWTRALRYKKPIIPVLAAPDAEMPFRLEPRQRINFTSAYDPALAQLRQHLTWMDSPAGQLQALKHRLTDAQRDLPRAAPEQQPRIQDDIAELQRQIAQQQSVIDNPQAAEQRVQQSIDRGLERVRQPEKPVSKETQTKFINPPPLIAPTWFQDRHVETQLIGDFLKDDALRLMTVVGRGGIGKSAIVCRLLRSLESGQLPDDGGPLPIDGIVYLSDARSFRRVNVPDLYASLTQLLPDETRRKLDLVYKNPQATTRQTMEALLAAFPHGRTVVLLDNFESEIDTETGRLNNADLREAIRAVLEFSAHGIKIIITTRVSPGELALVEPSRQRRVNLGKGLEYPYAENILRAMDPDGKIGVRDATAADLALARERTRGNPRALENLFGILSADRETSLQDFLDNTAKLQPDRVVTAFVGEAFNSLDLTAQLVMQALAIYRFPVPPPAVDYLLQPLITGVDSQPVLGRLVDMHFAVRHGWAYSLGQIGREYAEGLISEGASSLQERAEEWFKMEFGQAPTANDKGSPTQPKVFVSYAWGDDSSESGRQREFIVDGLCTRLEAENWEVGRDKKLTQYGDRISRLMKAISRAELVIVVLSEKYLRSPYCVAELYGIYQRALGEEDEFLDHIIPLALEDARIESWEDRLEVARYWQAKYRKMEKEVKKSPDLFGSKDFELYKSMKDWNNNVSVMLSYVNDTLHPRGFDEVAKDDFSALRQMLQSKHNRKARA